MKERTDLQGGVAWAIVFAIVALVASIIALAKTNPRILDIDYLGIIVSILALMVTTLIGWQVFNAIEMRSVIREFDKLKSKVSAAEVANKSSIKRINDIHEAHRLLGLSKDINKMLSERYINAAKSANLYLQADISPTNSDFVSAISQLERVLELSNVVNKDKVGNFIDMHKELDELYKSIMQHLLSDKNNLEQLILDINECHNQRSALSAPKSK